VIFRMRAVRLAKYLPRPVRVALFGDRERHGPVADEADADWRHWREIDLAFYDANQRQSVGSLVNSSGYRIMAGLPLDGRTILEIGPGSLDHMAQWSGRPAKFICVDINEGFMARAVEKLEAAGIPTETHITRAVDGGLLPLADGSVDLILSFYSLEHLHPLQSHIAEFLRVLKPGGLLVGAIPCEGGLGWGLGRYLTTRRWLLANGIKDPGKIISWEHPNFADTILSGIETGFDWRVRRFWPLRIPVIDANLVASFIAERRGA
jgi:SAM-dependent methyltransferase